MRFVYSSRNLNGAHTCHDATSVVEKELVDALKDYFTNLLKKNNAVKYFVDTFAKVKNEKEENQDYERELKKELEKLNSARSKYMDMYTDDLITRDELNEKLGGTREKIAALEDKLKIARCDTVGKKQSENILKRTFKNVEAIVSVGEMTNVQLKKS